MFENFTFMDIIDIIIRHIVVILICAIVFASASYFYTENFITKRYTSEVTLYMHINDASQQTSIQGNLTGISVVKNLMETYQRLMKSDAVLNEVTEKTGLDHSPDQIGAMTSISIVDADAQLFNLSVSSTAPENAYIITQTYAEICPKVLADVVPNVSLKTINEAEFPVSHSYPSNRNNTILGFLIGFILPTAIFILLEIFKISITDSEQLSARYDVPVIGNVPSLD